MVRELISSGERDNEAAEQPMNLVSDGCWGGRGSADAPTCSPQPCTRARGTREAPHLVPRSPSLSPSWHQSKPHGCASHLSTALSDMNLWGLCLTHKLITAAPQVGRCPQDTPHGHWFGATALFCSPSSHTQPAPLLLHTPPSLPPLISPALTSAWGLLAIERHVH